MHQNEFYYRLNHELIYANVSPHSCHLCTNHQRVNMNVLDAKRHQCSLCDRGFTRKYDLMRHEKTVHQEESEQEEGDSEVDDMDLDDSQVNDNNEPKDSEVDNSESEESSDEETSDELEDNSTYQEWYAQAMEATDEMRAEKYEKYIAEGLDQEQAKEKAYTKTLWAVKRVFLKHFTTFLWSYAHLKDDDLYQEITEELEDKMDNGVDINKAIKRVVAKYQAKFDGLFLYDEDADEGMETDDEDSI